MNLIICIFISCLAAIIPAVSFYIYGLFNDLSHFSIAQVYYSSVYAYLVGTTLFEFVIKPCRNKA